MSGEIHSKGMRHDYSFAEDISPLITENAALTNAYHFVIHLVILIWSESYFCALTGLFPSFMY